MKAILIGSIGALTETSEIQRQCFNQALAEAGTGLHWNVASYCELIKSPGGFNRLTSLGINASLATTIHERKQALFAEKIQGQITPRDGMLDLIAECARQTIKIGLVTTTTKTTVEAIMSALSDKIDFSHFSVVSHAGNVTHVKPASDIYIYALSRLGVSAHEVMAIEDTIANVKAAENAGIACLFTPGDYAAVPVSSMGAAPAYEASYQTCLSHFQKAA